MGSGFGRANGMARIGVRRRKVTRRWRVANIVGVLGDAGGVGWAGLGLL